MVQTVRPFMVAVGGSGCACRGTVCHIEAEVVVIYWWGGTRSFWTEASDLDLDHLINL